MKSKKEVEILSNQCTEVTNEVGTTTAFEYEGGNISNLFQQRKAVKTRHMFANSVGGGGAGGKTGGGGGAGRGGAGRGGGGGGGGKYNLQPDESSWKMF